VLRFWSSIRRDTFELACQWGAGEKSSAAYGEKALLTKVAGSAPGIWDASVVVQYLSDSPAFASGRSSWIALFTAVQNGDSAGMISALHQLEPIMQK